MSKAKRTPPHFLRKWLTKSPASVLSQPIHVNHGLIIKQSADAREIAARLSSGNADINLLRIDLKQVVSQYTDETEKNLGAIFKDAESKGAILFFDEADALFGKRTDVRDAHDKYARLASPYFLKLVEAYKGTIIVGLDEC